MLIDESLDTDTERYWRSRYTLAEYWEGEAQGILVNTFSGAVDHVPAEDVRYVRTHRSARLDRAGNEFHDWLIRRGYFVRSQEHEAAAARYMKDRVKGAAARSDTAKYMFGLTLRCNLACSYCWQVKEFKSSRQKTAVMSEELVEAAFRYIDADMKRLGKTRGVVSLFGGEPLIDKPQYHQLVESIGTKADKRGLNIHFTTNGRSLDRFMPEVERWRPSIQVTVDGVERWNGALTLMRAGQPLPGLLERLLDIASRRLTAGTFLRFLVEGATVDQFVEVADAIHARGALTGTPFALCVAPLQNKAAGSNDYMPKWRILQSLLHAIGDRGYARHIDFIDWRSLNILGEIRAGKNTIPMPAFYHCEANIDLTCFDQDGHVYACYEAIGDQTMSVGRYWPEVALDPAHLAQYRDRSAFTMAQCSECAVSPICGGGCEVRGYKHNGAYAMPYCDDLHDETAFLLRNWRDVVKTLTGA